MHYHAYVRNNIIVIQAKQCRLSPWYSQDVCGSRANNNDNNNDGDDEDDVDDDADDDDDW